MAEPTPSSNHITTVQVAEKLWCVHLTGADDMHPMPSRSVALEEANALNTSICRIKREDVDPVLIAVVAEWPHSADSHAAGLMIRDECLRMRGDQAVEAQAPAAVAVPTDFELRERWRAAGGSFHGPCVETGTMPEEQLLPFLRDLAATPSLPATEDSSAGDQVEAVHPDDAAVDALVAMMKAKLAKQRAKGYGGWNTQECSQQRLSDMLRDHVAKGDPVDVANFCAFLVARGEGIQAEVQPKTAELPKGVAQFTKKPVTINAIQWDGKNLYEVISFTQGVPNTRSERAQDAWDDYAKIVEREGLHIDTLEGKMLANVGDWIIRGVKGEHYPCKPDIFAATYETATAPQAQPADALDAERIDNLYIALEVCAAELFAQCGHQGRAMKYVEQARKALATEQCARAAMAAAQEGGKV